MTHSDDKGLVLPPRVAPIQVVIVPITKGPQSGADHDTVINRAEQLASALRAANVRVKVDTRYEMRPGAKYFEWERKGLPIRIDIGLRDLQKNSAVLSVRHSGIKSTIDVSCVAEFAGAVRRKLDTVHNEMLLSAKERLKSRTIYVSEFQQMKELLAVERSSVNVDVDVDADGCSTDANPLRPSFFLAPWKCNADNEAAVKEQCKATIRCYPFEQNQQAPAEGIKCFYSGQQATHIALFARAF